MSDITLTQLVSNFSSTNGQNFTTASFAPAANTLLIALIKIFGSGVGAITLGGAVGLSWDLIGVIDSETIASPTSRLAMLRTWTGASPGSGTMGITVGGSGNLDCHWDVEQVNFTDADVGDNGASLIVQSKGNASNSANNITVTFDNAIADAANAVLYGYAEAHGSSTDTANGGYLKIADLKDSTDGETMCVMWKLPGTIDPNMSDNGSSSARAAFAIEVKGVPSAPTPDVAPLRTVRSPMAFR